MNSTLKMADLILLCRDIFLGLFRIIMVVIDLKLKATDMNVNKMITTLTNLIIIFFLFNNNFPLLLLVIT